MAHLTVHCRDCENKLGKPYKEVHIWLDEFFKTLGPHHRIKRHHVEGVEEVRKKWGDEAAMAAEIHIKKDCYGKVRSLEEAKLWNCFL